MCGQPARIPASCSRSPGFQVVWPGQQQAGDLPGLGRRGRCRGGGARFPELREVAASRSGSRSTTSPVSMPASTVPYTCPLRRAKSSIPSISGAVPASCPGRAASSRRIVDGCTAMPSRRPAGHLPDRPATRRPGSAPRTLCTTRRSPPRPRSPLSGAPAVPPAAGTAGRAVPALLRDIQDGQRQEEKERASWQTGQATPTRQHIPDRDNPGNPAALAPAKTGPASQTVSDHKIRGRALSHGHGRLTGP
jgi:hypothetical protein